MKSPFRSRSMLLASWTFLIFISAFFEEPPLVDWETVARIREEGLQRSKVKEFESYIVDALGARLTMSRDRIRAQFWALDEMKDMGLSHIASEQYKDYGFTWDNEFVSAPKIEPDYTSLAACPVAHTASTDGTVQDLLRTSFRGRPEHQAKPPLTSFILPSLPV